MHLGTKSHNPRWLKDERVRISVMHQDRSYIASLECQNILICNVNLAGTKKPQAVVSKRIYLNSITIHEDGLTY